MFTRDAAATAQQMTILGEGDVLVAVTVESELTLGELTQVSTLGVGSDRSLERPKEWNGESSGFDEFFIQVLELALWLQGDAERFLE